MDPHTLWREQVTEHSELFKIRNYNKLTNEIRINIRNSISYIYLKLGFKLGSWVKATLSEKKLPVFSNKIRIKWNPPYPILLAAYTKSRES